jgi:alkanesulfonate monooxygenase
MESEGHRGLELFSTCPPSWAVPRDEYLRRVAEVGRWSDEAGYRGILVYTDNSLVDPWLLAQVILQHTESLCPLVAVQPVYMHPYTAAKMVASFAHLYRRRLYLNMVAGGFVGDLKALGDEKEHDERYARLVEYTRLVKELLGGGVVSSRGSYYRVENLRLAPEVPPEYLPGFMVSGSSGAGLEAARAIGATAVKYPQPPGAEVDRSGDSIPCGVRVGIIAREDTAEAWRVALERFPEDRRGQITHALAMSVSDSRWHAQLSRLGESPVSAANPYWLGPFQNYKTFCPYLVGSYADVGRELARYMALGYRTFILDVPASQAELQHIGVAFQAAEAELASSSRRAERRSEAAHVEADAASPAAPPVA